MKLHLKIICLIFVFALGAGADDFSFGNLANELSDIKPQVISGFFSPSPAEIGVAASGNSVEREWLVMVYIAAANDLGLLGSANSDINEMERADLSEKISVVVKYNILGVDNRSDRNLNFQRGSKTIYIRHDDEPGEITSPVIASGDNSDMGDWQHLRSFAEINMKKFPAKKTMLIVWNHGSGRNGIASDDVSENEMDLNQLGLALKEITGATGKKLDVLAMDACLMQMASVAYEIKDYAKVIVGSEETITSLGYPYRLVLNGLSDNPAMDAKELGNTIVKVYSAFYEGFGGAAQTTLSSIDASLMPRFVKLLNNWISDMPSDTDDFKKAASESVIKKTFFFDNSDVFSIDLCDFIDNVGNALPEGSRAKESGKILRNFVTDNLILSHIGTGAKMEGKWPYNERTCGLAIYMPEMIYDAKYENLSFAEHSLWDDFVKDIMRARFR